MKSAKAREIDTGPGFSITDYVAGGVTVLLARPRLTAGTAVFAILFSFFCANAIFSQSQKHPRALFSTRTLAFDPSAVAKDDTSLAAGKAKSETRVVLDRSGGASEKPKGDERVAGVQKILKQLGLYHGEVDGLTGPKTGEAIRNYQQIVGIPQSGEIDDALMSELMQSPAIVSAIPTPRPGRGPAPELPATPEKQLAAADTNHETAMSDVQPEPAVLPDQPMEDGGAGRIARIQAGLRAFGHDQIEIDGVAGEATVKAIREFQSLFRLEPTGTADMAVEAKMQEIGLIN